MTARIQAALLVCGEQAAISGVTALRLAEVDLPPRLVRDTRVWVQIPDGRRGPRRGQIRTVRPRTPGPIGQLEPFPIVDLPYCWLALAGECSLDELVELADAMTCRQRPVVENGALRALVDISAGVHGIARARQAVELSVAGTDSIPETDLRLLLVRAGLPAPIVNHAVRDHSGRVVYWLDLAYADRKLAVEYDGAVHVQDRVRMEQDAMRRRWLEDRGWRVITVTSRDLFRDPLGVVASVRLAFFSQR